jgi:hypothetical protein
VLEVGRGIVDDVQMLIAVRRAVCTSGLLGVVRRNVLVMPMCGADAQWGQPEPRDLAQRRPDAGATLVFWSSSGSRIAIATPSSLLLVGAKCSTSIYTDLEVDVSPPGSSSSRRFLLNAFGTAWPGSSRRRAAAIAASAVKCF